MTLERPLQSETELRARSEAEMSDLRRRWEDEVSALKEKLRRETASASESARSREAEIMKQHEAELRAYAAEVEAVRDTAKREIEQMRMRHEHAIADLQEKYLRDLDSEKASCRAEVATARAEAAAELTAAVEAHAAKDAEWAKELHAASERLQEADKASREAIHQAALLHHDELSTMREQYQRVMRLKERRTRFLHWLKCLHVVLP